MSSSIGPVSSEPNIQWIEEAVQSGDSFTGKVQVGEHIYTVKFGSDIDDAELQEQLKEMFRIFDRVGEGLDSLRVSDIDRPEDYEAKFLGDRGFTNVADLRSRRNEFADLIEALRVRQDDDLDNDELEALQRDLMVAEARIRFLDLLDRIDRVAERRFRQPLVEEEDESGAAASSSEAYRPSAPEVSEGGSVFRRAVEIHRNDIPMAGEVRIEEFDSDDDMDLHDASDAQLIEQRHGSPAPGTFIMEAVEDDDSEAFHEAYNDPIQLFNSRNHAEKREIAERELQYDGDNEVLRDALEAIQEKLRTEHPNYSAQAIQTVFESEIERIDNPDVKAQLRDRLEQIIPGFE